MKQALIIFAILMVIAIKTYAFETPDYYGSESSEAVITFQYFVETSTPAEESMAKLLINKQVTYLFGSFSANEYQAVPKADHKINVLSTEKTTKGYRINYQYQGTAVVMNGAPTNFRFPLPRNPETIYSKSLIKSNGQTQYGCNSDYEHTQEIYFWYFWNPSLYGCPMTEGQDYDYITSKLTRKTNTTKTYPEYTRLGQQNGEDRVIRIDLLMGLNDESQSTNPFQSTDIASGNYRSLHSRLLAMGYTAKVWTAQEIRAIAPQSRGNDAFVETLWKKTATSTVEIRFFFGFNIIFDNFAFF